MTPEVSEGLTTIAECIQKSGRDIVNEIEGESDGGDPVSGFTVTHGDETIDVVTAEGMHYFELQYDYDIAPDVAAARCIEEQADGALAGEGSGTEIRVEMDDTDIEEAMQWIAQTNQQRDSAKIKKFQSELIQLLSNPNCGFGIKEDLNGPHGFQISKKQFVYEPDYRASDFDSACQTVVSVAIPAQNFLQRAYNIEINLEQGGDDQPQTLSAESRGFQ